MIQLSRKYFDVGLLTQQHEAMLAFWRDDIGLPVLEELNPVDGVFQYKLDLKGAVLKLNCVDMELPTSNALSGLRLLMIVDSGITSPRHLKDPDGNLVCLVPPGHSGIQTFGVHFAVSNEEAFGHFYRDILQLPLIAERAYDLGGAVISYGWSPDVVAGADTTGVGYYYLTLQVMDAAATHSQLCDRGAVEDQAASSQHTSTASIISFILDPDGNKIEISERPDLVERNSNLSLNTIWGVLGS
jgi:catechol 2,3-dioxygenase-like lactoylglutathione lyase family enzyme